MRNKLTEKAREVVLAAFGPVKEEKIPVGPIEPTINIKQQSNSLSGNRFKTNVYTISIFMFKYSVLFI